MSRLVDSGASVIIVSHALEQISRFCQRALWIERGRIVQQGPALDVIKAYTQFLQILEDRRLKARNYKRRTTSMLSGQLDYYANNIVVEFTVTGDRGAAVDISEINLLKNGIVDEQLMVGDTQDVNSYYPAYIVQTGQDWSPPQSQGNKYYRRIKVKNQGTSQAHGRAVFTSFAFFEGVPYDINFVHQSIAPLKLSVTVWKDGDQIFHQEDISSSPEWTTTRVSLGVFQSDEELGEDWKEDKPLIIKEKESVASQSPMNLEPKKEYRWPSEGSLIIKDVHIKDEIGNERTVFQSGSALIIEMNLKAKANKEFNLVPAVTFFRIDGICVSNNIGEMRPISLHKGEVQKIILKFPQINLGSGYYVFSISIFDQYVDEDHRYDLIDKSYEFQVVDNDPLTSVAVFTHPSEWIWQ